jgi:hypothetical protein
MSSIFDLLGQHLGDDTVAEISRQAGTSVGATRSVVETAVPMLVSALARNASSGEAQSILGALTRDHDGSLLDDLGSFLGGGNFSLGDGILGHVLGRKRDAVESTLGRSSGLDGAQVARILALLAPIVMAALGKLQRRRDLDAGGLSDLLEKEQTRATEVAPDLMSSLGSLLDRDGDGSMLDDLAASGIGVLGSLLGGKR